MDYDSTALSEFQVDWQLVPFFKRLNAITASTVSNSHPILLGETEALTSIAAAQRIACVVIGFFIIGL